MSPNDIDTGSAPAVGPSANGHAGNEIQEHRDSFSTRAIHVGSAPDPVSGAIIPGLHTATTYKQSGVGKPTGGHDYSRTSNPTRNSLEALLTSLETCPESHTSVDGHEDASGGAALVFSSGSAATAAMAYWASLQRSEGGGGGRDGVKGGGGHVLAVNDCYGGTARFLSRAIQATGVEVTYLDFEEAGEEGIRGAIRPDTRLLWLEVPTNPLLLVPPLPLIAKIINSLPADTRPLVVVDTTFLSPFYITPLVPATAGALPLADIVLTSLSKYSSGHSDIILGSLTLSPALIKSRSHVLQGLRFLQNSFGGVPSPRDCHLMIRSIKTLAVRALRHGLNGLHIAHWLSEHPDVEDVRYPGLSTSVAFHQIEHLLSANARKELEYLGWEFPYQSSKAGNTAKQGGLAYARGLGVPFGGMIAFRLKGADEAKTEKWLTSLRLISLAESLGGVESLVEAPYGMTHASLPAATREKLGITPSLIRLSVGIEDVDDLIADLEQALKSI